MTPAARRLDEATGGAITRALSVRVAVQRQEGRASADHRSCQSVRRAGSFSPVSASPKWLTTDRSSNSAEIWSHTSTAPEKRRRP